MRTNGAAAAAAVVVGLEGLGLLALALWQVPQLSAGELSSAPTGVALLVLTLVGAVSVIAFAVAILRGRSWGRSGGVVTQLLILAVALGAVTGAYAQPLTGLALAAPAILALVLLVVASRRAAREAGDGSAPTVDP